MSPVFNEVPVPSEGEAITFENGTFQVPGFPTPTHVAHPALACS